jgi:hypothetical protein
LSSTDSIEQLRAELERLSGAARMGPLTRLGQALAARYWQSGPNSPTGPADLNAAIKALNEAYGYLLVDDDDLRPLVAGQLGLLLALRHVTHTHDEQDRNTAIHRLNDALVSPNLTAGNRSMYRIMLGQLYLSGILTALQSTDSAMSLLTGNIKSSLRSRLLADADLAVDSFRAVLMEDSTTGEIKSATETFLEFAEITRAMVEGDDLGPNFARLMDAMQKMQTLQARMSSVTPLHEQAPHDFFTALEKARTFVQPYSDLAAVAISEFTDSEFRFFAQGPRHKYREMLQMASNMNLTEPSVAQISVYLDSNDQHVVDGVLAALHDLFDSEDLTIELAGDPKISSWWGRFTVRTKTTAKQEGVTQRLAKIEHAVEVVGLRQPMAIENAKQAEAISALVTAIEKIDNAVILAGSVALIKYTDMNNCQNLFTKTLSVAEVRAFEQNQHLLANPQAALDHLHLLANASAEPATPSDWPAHPSPLDVVLDTHDCGHEPGALPDLGDLEQPPKPPKPPAELPREPNQPGGLDNI